jgi:hypothetical protein
MRLHLAHLAVLLALTAVVGCKNTVTVQGDQVGAGTTAGAGAECLSCTAWDIGDHYAKGLPFCPGEQEKYDALLACACQASTCASPDEQQACGGSVDFLCEGGLIGGSCEKCLREKCPEAWRGCCPEDWVACDF